MTEHDEVPSVDNDALASAEQQDPAGAPATPPQQAVGTARLQQLIRDKQAAEALAATSAAQAAALRERPQSPARPQDYRAPEQYTRAIAEQAVREVGAEILARQASQAQEAAARAAKDAWAEATAAFREKAPDFEAVAHNPDLAITPVMADAIRESSRGAEIAYYLGKNPAEDTAANAIAQPDIPSLPAPNSVAFVDGYLAFSIPDGRIFHTALNDASTVGEQRLTGFLRAP